MRNIRSHKINLAHLLASTKRTVAYCECTKGLELHAPRVNGGTVCVRCKTQKPDSSQTALMR